MAEPDYGADGEDAVSYRPPAAPGRNAEKSETDNQSVIS
jgi:hypothetical protein